MKVKIFDEEDEKDLASSSNATPVEEDNIDKEIETEENEEESTEAGEVKAGQED